MQFVTKVLFARLLVLAAQAAIIIWLISQLFTWLPKHGFVVYTVFAGVFVLFVCLAHRIVTKHWQNQEERYSALPEKIQAFDGVDRATVLLAISVLTFSAYQLVDQRRSAVSQAAADDHFILLTLYKFTDRHASKSEPTADKIFDTVATAIKQLSSEKIEVLVDRFADGPQSQNQSPALRYFLSGETFKTEIGLVLSIRLTAAPSGQTVWQHEYALSQSDNIASTVAAELRQSVSLIFKPDETTTDFSTRIPASANERAYTLYLEAAQLYRRNKYFDRSNNKQAIALLEEATELDTEFAVAWARLANAYASASWFGYFETNEERVYQTLYRISELLGAEHYITLRTRAILLYQLEGRLSDARHLLLRALDKLPNDAASNSYLGFIERRLGESDAARAHLQDVLAVDPTFFPAITVIPHIIAGQGDVESLRHFLVATTKPQIGDDLDFLVFIAELYDKYSPETEFLYRALLLDAEQAKSQGLLSSFLILRDPGPKAQALYDERESALRIGLEGAVDAGKISEENCGPMRRLLLARAIWERNYRTVNDGLATIDRFFDLLKVCAEAVPSPRALREPTDKAIGLAISGNRKAAEAALSELTLQTDALEDRLEAGLIYVNLARLALLLEDTEKLVRLINKADEATQEFSALAQVMKFPEFDPYRSSPPFREMIDEHEQQVGSLLQALTEIAEISQKTRSANTARKQ